MNRIGLGLEHRQTMRHELKIVITPQLQQAIKLLQLNHMEMAETLQEEMLENPLLEENQESEEEMRLLGEVAQGAENEIRREENEIRREENGMEGEGAEGGAFEGEGDSGFEQQMEVGDPETPNEALVKAFEEVDWEAYFEDSEDKLSLPSNREDLESDLPPPEARLTGNATFQEELFAQLSVLRLHDDVREMAALLIGNLNEDGWLIFDGEDGQESDVFSGLAQQMVEEERHLARERGEEMPEGLEESLGYWREIAEEALEAIQGMEPYGVGARSLEESLLIQCRMREDIEENELLERLIQNHLRDLEKRNYAGIAKQIRVSLEDLLAAHQIISHLEPHPARNYITEPTAYITPDIYIKKVGEDYFITLNDDGLPKLKISSAYKSALKEKGPNKEFIQEKLKNAAWLLRSIQQRQQTIYKVTESIVQRQRDFLEYGISALKPMILRDVAEDIEMHESTISRVTSNKYVHTPQGIFELKFFFTSSLQSSTGGEDVSSLTVKDKIKKMVSEEDLKNPLSDQQIVEKLETEGIQIARRTVAKYRAMLNILPSNRRKQPF